MQAHALRMRRSSLLAALRLDSAIEPKPTGAIGKRLKPSAANDSALPERTESPVAAKSRGLTQHEPDQQAN